MVEDALDQGFGGGGVQVPVADEGFEQGGVGFAVQDLGGCGADELFGEVVEVGFGDGGWGGC